MSVFALAKFTFIWDIVVSLASTLGAGYGLPGTLAKTRSVALLVVEPKELMAYTFTLTNLPVNELSRVTLYSNGYGLIGTSSGSIAIFTSLPLPSSLKRV